MPPVNKPSASSILGENSFPECMVTSGLIQMFMQLHIKKKNKETLTGPEFSSQDWAHKEVWVDIFPKKRVTCLFYEAIMSPKYFTSRYFVLILCSSAAVFVQLVSVARSGDSMELLEMIVHVFLLYFCPTLSSTHFLFQFLTLATQLSFHTAKLYLKKSTKWLKHNRILHLKMNMLHSTDWNGQNLGTALDHSLSQNRHEERKWNNTAAEITQD